MSDKLYPSGERRNFAGAFVRIKVPQVIVSKELADQLTTDAVIEWLAARHEDGTWFESGYVDGRPIGRVEIDGVACSLRMVCGKFANFIEVSRHAG